MSFLTLDIETVPQWRFTEPDVAVDEKWREEFLEKREAEDDGDWVLESVTDALKSGEAKLKSTGVQAALHASTAHVVSVSWGNGDDGETTVRQWDDYTATDAGGETDQAFEAHLVGKTFRAIAVAILEHRTIVSFSGKPFDLPMLRWRAALLGVEIPKIKWDGPGYRGDPSGLLYPYDNLTHCDLRNAWTNGNRYGKGTLAAMSEAFGIENQEHGGDVYEWFKASEWDKIREYGHQEARNLIALYRACERIL